MLDGSGTSEAMARVKSSVPFGSDRLNGVLVGLKIGAVSRPV